MKASFTLRSALDKIPNIVGLIAVMAWVLYPATHAQAANNSGLQISGNRALVFEVKNLPTKYSKVDSENTDQNLIYQSQITTAGLSYEELTQADPLVKNLRDYLNRHNSPLAEYADQIVLQPQWQRSLAISWGESNFGLRCYQNNCSGIGGAPGRKTWRAYPTKLEWFKDMAKLMEKPLYKDKYTSCKTMNGVYNAGSLNWLRACEQKSAELIALTEKSEQERLALVNNGNLNIAGFAEVDLK